jgi:hypothetical protein
MVEVGFELIQADRQDLAAQVLNAFDVQDCADELRFAVKHGLEDYEAVAPREHGENSLRACGQVLRHHSRE